MIVHFPIVLLILVAIYEVAVTLMGRDVTGRSATGNVAVGALVLAALAAIMAFYFGDLALSFAEDHGFESDVAEIHESLGRIVMYATSIWAVIRAALWLRNVRLKAPIAYLMPLVSLAGAGLVTYTAYYGGKLVFDLGVNVAKATGAA